MRLIANRRAAAAPADPLASFDAETPEAAATVRRVPNATLPLRAWLVLGAAAAVTVAAIAAGSVWQRRAGAAPTLVTLSIESTPAGADVLVGGASRGRTPLTIQVPAGSQGIEVVRGTDRIPVRVAGSAGSVVSQHVVFGATAAAAPVTASLVVTTEPARLKVSIDNVPQGASPASVSGLAPGPHRVQVTSADGVREHVVELKAGETVSLVLAGARPAAPAAPPAPAAGAGGWLVVASSVPLQLFEGGQIIGSSASSRIMLPAGSHDIEFANDELGFRGRRKVQVSAGGTTPLTVALPKAPLSINAIPWADVSVDGERVGETPIGNYTVTIGRREVVFRHPELGERRQTVVVGLKTPARVTMDLKSK